MGGKKLETWKEANIVLIPKEGLDLTLTRHYRLKLYNNDYKLFHIAFS